jgi:hypothetical protein
LYEAAYRWAAAGDIAAGSEDAKRADADHGRAIDVANKLQGKYPQSDYADRAAGLVYKVEQSIPLYGITQDATPDASPN